MKPRHKLRQKKKIEGQFAPRTIEMLWSSAMRVLSLSGRRILERLECENAAHAGTENGRLPCTYADFMRFGIDRHAVAPGIREVVALGFVEITEKGRAGNREFRSPSLYRLTFCHTDHEPTNEWKRIKTAEEAEEIARHARSTPDGHASSKRSRKQKTGVGKRHISVGETHTEKVPVSVGETHTVAAPVFPHYSLYLGQGAAAQNAQRQGGDAHGAPPAQRSAALGAPELRAVSDSELASLQARVDDAGNAYRKSGALPDEDAYVEARRALAAAKAARLRTMSHDERRMLARAEAGLKLASLVR